jgi:hypothetical protein
MRPEPPPSQRELLLNRGGGWAVRYPRATAAVGPQGLPLVAARRWDTGVSAQWDGGTVDAGVAVTMGTLSSPQFDDDNGGKQISGRVGFTPTASFSIGVSAASGEYLADAGGSTDYGDVGGLPPPASYETHRQQALGLDAEYSLGHVVVRGEVVASRWDVPFQNGDPTLELDGLGTSLETRVALTPRWSMSVRGDRLGFSRMTTNGVVRTWDANVLRVEGAVGYLVRRNVRLKASYQYNWRDGGRERSIGLAGAQILYWF